MRERGSALVSVILVLLVLTIVGVGIAYFTSMEDRLSGNTRITKAGFYAADAGLRRGEALLTEVITLPVSCGPQSLSGLLTARTPPVLKVPGGGFDAQVLDLSTLPPLAVGCLGTDASKYLDVPITRALPLDPLVVDRVSYSLYLRNNVDDAQGTDTVDTDNIVNLVSVGRVVLPAGVVVTKIVEEQLILSSGGGSTGAQKDVNAGGTNTITGRT